MAIHTRLPHRGRAGRAGRPIGTSGCDTSTARPRRRPKPHHLRMYKVEKYVAIDGEYPDNTGTSTVSCNAATGPSTACGRSTTSTRPRPTTATRWPATRATSTSTPRTRPVEQASWHVPDLQRQLRPGPDQAVGDLPVEQHREGARPQPPDHRQPLQRRPTRPTPVTNYFEWNGSCARPTRSRSRRASTSALPAAHSGGSWPEQTAGQPGSGGSTSMPRRTPTFYISCLSLKTGNAGSGTAHRHKILADWTPDTATGHRDRRRPRAVDRRPAVLRRPGARLWSAASTSATRTTCGSSAWSRGSRPVTYRFWNDGGGERRRPADRPVRQRPHGPAGRLT